MDLFVTMSMLSFFIVRSVLIMPTMVLGTVFLMMSLNVLGLGCGARRFTLISHGASLFTLNYFVQFSTIQPNPAALGAIIDFYSLSFCHH